MHLFTLLHSEMPKALTILSTVINKIHLYLKKRSMKRVNLQNAFIYLTTLRNAQALSILSAVVYEIHLHLIMSLMRAYISNTFINFIALRNVKFITIDLIL